jgi:hypothetical protein
MPKKPAKTIPDLSPAEMKMLERLIDAGILIAVPPQRMGKPRPVISASLIGGGKNVLLYLSREPVELG